MKQLGLFSDRTRRGASVLIAILVFFLAALSGTVALTMSASNAGRYAHEREDQQAYLYCASAAKLILSRLTDLDVVFRSTSKSSPVTSEEVEVILCKRTKDSEGNIKREELAPNNKDMFLGDDNFKSMLADYALNAVMKTVEFSLYLNDEVNNKVYVSIQRYGANFNFDFWVQKGNGRDYQMSMSQILGSFDESIGVGGGAGHNFYKYNGTGDGILLKDYYYRILQFNVDGATFTVGNLV